MINEEIDETEFYQQDFTTASEWEIFIAAIEEIINQWKAEDLKNAQEEEEQTSGEPWTIKTEQITYVDFDFTLSIHRKVHKDLKTNHKKKTPFDTFRDFELYDPKADTDHSCLGRWYGIDEFIVLSPTGNVGVTTESRIKILLSSVYVATANLKCDVPMFVQIREKWQRCYMGVSECDSIRTNLEMVHLKTMPRQCQFVHGLIEIFKSKIVAPTMMSTIIVSYQSSYKLTDFGAHMWRQDYLNLDNDTFDIPALATVPFGVTIDPIESLVLKATWRHLNHRAVRDNESVTDFSPLLSNEWSLLTTITDQPISLLGDCLTEYCHLMGNPGTTYDVLGGDFGSASFFDVGNPLDVLTESKVPTIGSLISRAARNSLPKNKRGAAPLSEEILVPMLYFLFPDAEDDSPFVYKDGGSRRQSEGEKICLDHECRGFKTCAPDSLVWRLSIILGHALQSLGGVRAFCHFWFEFVQEMRYRWEKSIAIPGLLPGYPDLRTSLLHQKLQMLNCCIDRKATREKSKLTNAAVDANKVVEDESLTSSTDEEEFFDCADKPEKEKYSLWNQPVGRLGKFNDYKLLKTGDPLYIPVTQEPVPKSEDQLEEDTNVLLTLGSDAQGSELRAKMMSASLLSDMESFKAANPGSILDDFIRWYSPRDWIENEGEDATPSEDLDEWGQKTGHLSPRMMIEDNFWVQTWNSAKPVPANRQKRLFDDTREAEKVLHFLDSRTLTQITELLVPVASHVAIYKLWDELQSLHTEIPDAIDRVRSLVRSVERTSRDAGSKLLQTRRFEGFVQEVTALELKVSQVNSLLYKLNPPGSRDEGLSDLVGKLVAGAEVEIEDAAASSLGRRLVAMFSDAQRSANMILPDDRLSGGDEVVSGNCFPAANEREIVMRVAVARPASYSVECPQFLRAVLRKNEFRLVGAFSEDVVFF